MTDWPPIAAANETFELKSLLAFEGRSAVEHLVYHTPQCPEIDGPSEVASVCVCRRRDLRREVGRRAAMGLEDAIGADAREAKVAELEVPSP